MAGWLSVIVKFGGQFDDYSNYIGGEERLALFSDEDISVEALKSSIEPILRSVDLVGDYWIYYISTMKSGRNIRSVLSRDD